MDSPLYKKFSESLPDNNSIPILLQLCWDGAEIFNTVKADSMWPLTYSITNLPPCLRNQLNVGLHVLGFDLGSTACINKCAEELLNLYERPIEMYGCKFYVMVTQIIMDGKGRESYCKLQSQRGFAGGCHVCDFKGRAFGNKRTIYDGYRRYTSNTRGADERRKAKSEHNRKAKLYFSFDENLDRPMKRKYEDYIRDGLEAEELNRTSTTAKKFNVNGVKGVWCLHILPYASKIHWTYDLMHTFNNVITDALSSIVPTYSGKAGLLYPNENRTICSSVIDACKSEKIHRYLYDGTVPPWVLSVEDCINIDKMQHYIIGQFTSEEFVTNVMRGRKAKRSHDTIYWACVYSRWLLRNRGPVIDNILDVFEMMAVLNSNRLHVPTIMGEFYTGLIDNLIKRSGLVPPSECTTTLHELLHVCDQVQMIGAPRYSTLYKFEKVNKLLKSFCFNKAKGVKGFILYLDVSNI
jgi:hypothetical protein